MGGRQIEPAEADTLLSTREVGPLDGFRSRIGRPFSAKIRLTDANEVEFDFGPRADADDGPAPDFSAQTPLGPCPKCGNRVFETPNAYVCERAVGEGRTCDFRSGRMILQRPIEPAQMSKLLETGKTDLLQFVSARTRRPFSAFLVKQADGKVGFEFEAKDPARKGARGVPSAPRRVLGNHPRDRQPIELHAGRYGPYVKHGTTNATLPDRDKVDSLTLDEAIALVDEKAGRSPARTPRRTVGTRAPRKAPEAAERPAATTTRRTRTAAGNGATAARAAAKPAVKTVASGTRGAARKSATKTGAVKKIATGVAAVKKAAIKRPPTKRRASPAAAAPPRTAVKSTKRAGARTRK
jgi:DNA topoisomerase-3